ncbi:heptaprenylglyceryl phosphate synthase [Scopulibacillus cellulosilyticus]|uniref:Heptaprenylglyceryl phosphate synthase n=1 Tax=Scopulibacillus cellulosilyticus TaxID=2665665 RepID=A0ABW2PYZ0_9BACL
METYKEWQHAFKLDPNRPIGDDAIEKICESGTDAVIVGGTDGVTLDNTLYLLSRIRQFAVDCALEISNLDAVTPGFDYYFIPTVLNTGDSDWIVGKHHEAVKAFGETINWDEVVVEGYCILNPDAKAAQLTEAQTNLSIDDVSAYAMMAEKMFKLPVFYLEYSGQYGNIDIVKKVRSQLKETKFFYGGGIHHKKQAEEMAQFADTVIVGNAVYDNLKEALRTVRAVKKVKNGD